MCHRLLTASIKNEIAPLDEVIGLLNELSEAWSSIKPAATATVTDGVLSKQQTQDSATTHYGAA
jgi:flagellin-specific chaperone FliS